jgi:membrane protein implicated in regulation of membrane protease activity
VPDLLLLLLVALPLLLALPLALVLPAAGLLPPCAAALAAAAGLAFFLLTAIAEAGVSSERTAEAARKSRRFNRLSGKRGNLIARRRQHGSVAKNNRAVSQDTARQGCKNYNTSAA